MWTALLLATAAGFSTTIGSLLGLVVKRPRSRFIGFTLGFSAGVMILVAFVELLARAVATKGVGFLGAHIAFFAGMGAYLLLDFFIPHEYIGQGDYGGGRGSPGDGETRRSLERTGILVALGISIHNFPEGMATFVGALEDMKVGVAIAVAIAIHNIPEGLAISAPIYAATGSRARGFWWSALSGAAEIAGAVLAAGLLMPFLTERVMGFVLAGVAGIMVILSLDELIPAAKAYASEHTPILGVMVGMAVMVLSLWLLK